MKAVTAPRIPRIANNPRPPDDFFTTGVTTGVRRVGLVSRKITAGLGCGRAITGTGGSGIVAAPQAMLYPHRRQNFDVPGTSLAHRGQRIDSMHDLVTTSLHDRHDRGGRAMVFTLIPSAEVAANRPIGGPEPQKSI